MGVTDCSVLGCDMLIIQKIYGGGASSRSRDYKCRDARPASIRRFKQCPLGKW